MLDGQLFELSGGGRGSIPVFLSKPPVICQDAHARARVCVCVFVDFLFIVTPIVGVCNCSMFCCTLLYVHSSIAIILVGKRELVALLNLSSWCIVMVERLFLAVPWGFLRFVIVVFPDHTHLLFLSVYVGCLESHSPLLDPYILDTCDLFVLQCHMLGMPSIRVKFLGLL